MSYALEYEGGYPLAAEAAQSERAAFIRRTYAHLAGAILAFIGLEAALLQLPIGEQILGALAASRWSWLVVLGAFMVVSWVADRWAQSDMPVGMQYLGLGLYVSIEAVIFLPLLYIASARFGVEIIRDAGIMTLAIFVGLTAAVLLTKKDFSFLRTALVVGGWLAFAFILASIFFDFSLGLVFCFAMVAFASGYILYHTSNVLHHYRTDQHVAASLALFSSVALLFWYVLRIFMSSRD